MTTQTIADRHITVAAGRAFAGSGQRGYRACVDAGGAVTVYDSIAGHYTACHSLTPAQVARIRRMAR